MKTKVWLGALCLLATTAAARDLEDILKEKKVIDPMEANEAKAAKEKAAEATDKAVASIPALPDWVKKVTLFGDVRVRSESFFRKDTPQRNRQRFRLRFGAKAKLDDETELGMKIASGNPKDPISNNQTFTDDFTFKDLNITNGYIKYSPYKWLGLDRPWLTLMGGKFDTPTYVPTRLIFDGDLTPEGFFESLKLVEDKEGVLQALSLNLGQWIFQENSTTGEAVLYAFQGATGWAFGDVKANLAVGDYLYIDESSIAVDRNKNTSLQITNTVTLSDGTVVGGRSIDPTKFGPNKDGMTAPTVDPATGATIPGKPITIKRFNSQFNDVNVAGDLTFPTGAKAFPLKVFGDYVKNVDASGSEDQGYQGGALVGLSKDPGDFFFSYAYQRLETDAVISAFTDSDFGRDGGTNTKGHILQTGYTLTKNLSFVSTAWITKPVKNVSGRPDDQDYRWQVDVIAKF